MTSCQKDEISGSVTATGKNIGLWNAGTLKKISGGTFTGKEVDGLQNVDLSEGWCYSTLVQYCYCVRVGILTLFDLRADGARVDYARARNSRWKSTGLPT
ncbi:hypothetical protein GK675_05745 [Bifidobacteriaceae bacterium NR002]|nr:hypothetical protein [Bifidobacteriaceae bacterium NR002]MDZ7550078.1 hypothetical protein [Bifidobacteriaceae bacterium NR047]